MSRAINLSVDPAAVTKMCEKHDIPISSIEPLQSGGTRVVLRSPEGAESIRSLMKNQLLEGPVVRGAHYLSRTPVSYSR